MKIIHSPVSDAGTGQAPFAASPMHLEGAEGELKLARDYAQAIIEAVPPLLILDRTFALKRPTNPFTNTFASHLRKRRIAWSMI